MGQIIAYARVSTDKQEFDRQVDALKSHGYDKLIQEKFTGTKRDRDGLNRLVEVSALVTLSLLSHYLGWVEIR